MVGLWLFSGLVEAGGGLKVSLSTSSEKDGECPFCASSREVRSAAGPTESPLVWLWVGERDARGLWRAALPPMSEGAGPRAPGLGRLRCSGR